MLCDEGELILDVCSHDQFGFSEINFCEKNPGVCQNGAKCVSLTKEDGNYRCMCREGTYGRNCEFSQYTTTKKPEITTTEAALNASSIAETVTPEEATENNNSTNLLENEAI